MSPEYLLRRYQATDGVPVVTPARARGAVVGVCNDPCVAHGRAHRRGGPAFQVRIDAGYYAWYEAGELRRPRVTAPRRQMA